MDPYHFFPDSPRSQKTCRAENYCSSTRILSRPEPHRPGSRWGRSRVPLGAAPRMVGDASSRHFERLRPFANVGVASWSPVSCSRNRSPLRGVTRGGFLVGAAARTLVPLECRPPTVGRSGASPGGFDGTPSIGPQKRGLSRLSADELPSQRASGLQSTSVRSVGSPLPLGSPGPGGASPAHPGHRSGAGSVRLPADSHSASPGGLRSQSQARAQDLLRRGAQSPSEAPPSSCDGGASRGAASTEKRQRELVDGLRLGCALRRSALPGLDVGR